MSREEVFEKSGLHSYLLDLYLQEYLLRLNNNCKHKKEYKYRRHIRLNVAHGLIHADALNQISD